MHTNDKSSPAKPLTARCKARGSGMFERLLARRLPHELNDQLVTLLEDAPAPGGVIIKAGIQGYVYAVQDGRAHVSFGDDARGVEMSTVVPLTALRAA